ncbi:calcium ATPase transmembrane domain M-containing protein [Mycena maculata]|uniref:Calcium ATPase transmembrane domain M-containing protein n=1 Tax=Mycena maculata TaxID=230809 RepID=A0AAD7K3Z8_9AGAR|nr:calcium ATPase transmembrane domain M-containing protein [Mycena maculata]
MSAVNASEKELWIRYSSHPTLGLDPNTVERKASDGKNVISPPPTQYWKKVLNYVFGGFNFLMWIAFIVTILSYQPLGRPDPAVFNLGVAVLLLLVIIISATFYSLVDFHASRVMKSIKSLVAQEATVVRGGTRQVIKAADLVVGDIVLVSVGDRVPADLRIFEMSSDLKFDRSLLTGESEAIAGSLTSTSDNPLETQNLALSSTFVAQGTCSGVVFAIGDKSTMGRIVAMSGETKFKMTPMQKEIWFFTKIISALALSLFCLSIIIWGAWLRVAFPGYLTGSEAIINSIGCLTAFVPQGLPLCVALSLTIIAKRMAKHNVLVKNLATIETLGCMSVLCSDKTGTLTTGVMTVESVAFFDKSYDNVKKELVESEKDACGSGVASLVKVGRLCNGKRLDQENDADAPDQRLVKGDATDSAILRFTELFNDPDSGVDTLSLIASHEAVYTIPFNSKNKWMLTVVRPRGSPGVPPDMLVKGAPDILVAKCVAAMNSDGTEVPLTESVRDKLFQLQSDWSSEGQRVLALCKRSFVGVDIDFDIQETVEESVYRELRGLTLVGLVSIRDPPRPTVKDTVAIIRRAGVRVFMVTGDLKMTAVAIAKQVGIITTDIVDTRGALSSIRDFSGVAPPHIKPSDDDGICSLVLTGEEIASFGTEEWDKCLGVYSEIVFARTTPEQKLRIVNELKARGDNVVAVTGDGTNDAPALKASDIGVAMGSGSDVAKEAAAMILLDNNFSSIPVAIEQGRLVFDNIKKVVLYLMPAGTYTEFMTVFANVFFGMQLALSSYLQVCFSITNDVAMSISLMFEKPEADLMLRKPRNARTDRLTDWRFFFQIYLFTGLMMWPCAMAMWFLYMDHQGLSFYDVILVYDKWTEGYKGFSTAQLTHFVSVGQCIYYVTMVFMQYGGLLSARNRRMSILNSNPLWGPRRNLAVPVGMVFTMLIAIVNLYGPGFERVFETAPIPGMFWGLPFAFAFGILCVDETMKLIVRTYPKSFVAKIAW